MRTDLQEPTLRLQPCLLHGQLLTRPVLPVPSSPREVGETMTSWIFGSSWFLFSLLARLSRQPVLCVILFQPSLPRPRGLLCCPSGGPVIHAICSGGGSFCFVLFFFLFLLVFSSFLLFLLLLFGVVVVAFDSIVFFLYSCWCCCVV